MSKRKYVLSKVAPGDYILPSNDAKVIWRIVRYTEGPSSGIEGWTKDRDVWGIWQYRGPMFAETCVDIADWERWEFCEGMNLTRREAVDRALGMAS